MCWKPLMPKILHLIREGIVKKLSLEKSAGNQRIRVRILLGSSETISDHSTIY